MSRSLADILPNGEGPGGAGGAGLNLWQKSSGYARRLLLGDGGDPWLSAAQFLSFFTQAQGLLRAEVAVVEVVELYQSWVGRHPDLAAEMGSKRRTSFPLRKLLEAEGPRKLLVEVLEAVAASQRGQRPMVLALPTPRAFLATVNAWIGRAGVEVEEDDVEDAAMYMADLLRAVSTLPVGGLLLEDGPGASATQPGDIGGLTPLVNVAKHYRWPLAMRLSEGTADDVQLALAGLADALIVARPAAELTSRAIGVDLGAALWDGAALPPADPWRFAFVEIPADMKPEAVLDALARARGRSDA